MQRYTIFFVVVNALHVSGGFSAHHQELKTVHTAPGICQACLLPPLAVAAASLARTRCCVYSLELLMLGGETARNM
jgi:hypothetical protein